MMEGLDFENFKVSIKSTNVPNTIAANRLLSQRIDYPLHLGVTESGTRWSGSLKSAVGLGRCWPRASGTRSASRCPPSRRRRR